MQIQVTQPALARALKLATASIHGGAPHEKLCRISAKDRTCSLYRAESIATMGVTFQGQIAAPGAVAVNAMRLREIIDTFDPKAELTLHATDDDLTVAYQRGVRQSIYTFQTAPPEDIPHFTEQLEGTPIPVSAPTLRRLLQQTKVSVAKPRQSQNETLTGIHLRLGSGELVAVATDTHRLVEAKADDDLNAPWSATNIPAHAVETILTMLDAETDDADVSITPSAQRATVRTPQAEYQFTLIAGTYPQYQRVLTQDVAHAFSVNQSDFSACLKRLSHVDEERHRCEVWREADGLLLKASSETGSATERVMAEFHAGDEKADGPMIAINITLARTLLSSIDGESIRVVISGAASPITIRPEPDTGKVLAVLMPMQPGQ